VCTILSAGDKENQIHMEGYQVSNQCMALVRDNCLLPTKDAAELGYVRESTDKQYVPDVFYKVSLALAYTLLLDKFYFLYLRLV
jgi:nuclear protein localization family protein 4